MRVRGFLLFATLVLLFAGLSLPARSAPQPASATGRVADLAAVSTPQSISFDMGYGPSDMSPVSDGIPVYTYGDSLWVMSTYDTAVNISLVPANGSPEGARTLQPQDVVALHSFSSGDQPGVWNITVGAPTGDVVVPFHLVETAGQGVAIDSMSYSLQGGTLLISGSVRSGFAYDQEVSALANSSVDAISFRIPSDLGAGNVTVSGKGGSILVATTGSLVSPFTFSFELFHQYSFSAMGTSILLTKSLEAAASQPFLVNSTSQVATPLDWNFHARDGRYVAKALFESQTSLVGAEGGIVMVNGSWSPLDPSATVPLTSQNFTLKDGLAGGPASWPRTVYLMYRILGVEGVTSVPVQAGLSGVALLAGSWGVPLEDASIRTAPNPSITQVSQQGNVVYLLGSQYPVKLNFSVSIGGGRAQSGSQTIESPYALTSDSVSAGRLTVKVAGYGAGASVLVSGGDGTSITRTVSGGNGSVFYVPPGSYNVAATGTFDSVSTTVTVADGSASSVLLDIGTFHIAEMALVVTASLGVASFLVYRFRVRRA